MNEHELYRMVPISAAQVADSYTLQEKAREAGVIGLFGKHDDTIVTTLCAARADCDQGREG